jgi:hypothetical protein
MKQLLSLLVLLCATATPHAQDDLASLGIRAFSETCLMPDPRLEKIYEWAATRELKMLEGRARQEDKQKGFAWEIAASGRESVLLIVSAGYELPRHMLSCEVLFREYRDPGKRIETFFLDEMRLRPNAKQEAQRLEGARSAYHFRDGDALFMFFSGPGPYPPDETPMVRFALLASQAPPDVAPATPTFATVERTYKSFVDYCMALFPNLPAIAERMNTTGWQRSGPSDMQYWVLRDPFNVMSGYLLELMQAQSQASCGLSFDGRAAIPMERLIRDYGLKRESDLDAAVAVPGSESTTEHYSAVVAGNRLVFVLSSNNKTRSGQLSVFTDWRP